MRLASIKLAGFKSFVEPSKIPFPDQMTCVVGPNGCGKSNVIDAVRWVLGESSAKNLRGDAMTDVIFNGSTERKPVSQASVELLFDNTEGRLPGTLASRNQVAIKRLVTRDGLSQYFINGEKCRKRDITDIFLGTGLGPRSYAIIEQGMISRLIESKPQDLRIFLEEAAGVSKYKERRRETQTRLNSTRDNLERLLDLRTELENQLAVLTEQAETAKQYTSAKATERTLKAKICVLKWQSLQQKLCDSEAKLSDVNDQIAFLEKAHLGHEDVILALKLAIEQANDAVNEAQHQEYQLRNKLARDEQDKVHKQAAKAQLIQKIALLEKDHLASNDNHTQVYKEVETLSQQLATSSEELSKGLEAVELSVARYEEQKSQQDSAYNDYQTNLQLCQDLSTSQSDVQNQLAKFNVEQAKLKQQQKALDDKLVQLDTSSRQLDLASQQIALEKLQEKQAASADDINRLEDVSKALNTDLIAQQARRDDARNTIKSLQAKYDALTLVVGGSEDVGNNDFLANLAVEDTWQLAVEASLFGLQNATIAEYEDGLSMPCIWQQGKSKTPGSLAQKVLSEHVPDYFNSILICEDINQIDQSKWQNGIIAFVNNQGDLRGPNWFIPSSFDKENSNLVKYQLLKAIQEELPEKQAMLAEIELDFENIETKLAANRALCDEMRHVLRELENQVTQQQAAYNFSVQQANTISQEKSQSEKQLIAINEQLSKLSDAITPLNRKLSADYEQLTQLKEKQAQSEQAYHRAKLLTHQMQTACEKEKSQHHKLQLHLESVKNQHALCENKLAQLTSQIKRDEAQLSECQTQLEDAEIPLVELDELIAFQHETLEEALQNKEQKRLDLEKAKEKLHNAESTIGKEQSKRDKLEKSKQALLLEQQSFTLKAEATLAPLAELNTQLKEVIAALTDEDKLPSLQAKLNRVSSDIDKLGAVNLAAIEEFDKAFERKKYLDEQYDDLTSALQTLETAIVKIDRETKQRFKATFDQVNSGLQNLFPKVFGGGSAYLELTSDDLLDTGVAIMARPPGKKNATIHLLSGGEKALTALSLVFSIFQLNPSPFCMLDEVDAPLDDANVGRFCRLVEEMSQDVQFVYISHNKIAMEMAARLTGVTMAEPGVSRVVAVDIEKALEMSESEGQ